VRLGAEKVPVRCYPFVALTPPRRRCATRLTNAGWNRQAAKRARFESLRLETAQERSRLHGRISDLPRTQPIHSAVPVRCSAPRPAEEARGQPGNAGSARGSTSEAA